jgi:hypothetical protein
VGWVVFRSVVLNTVPLVSEMTHRVVDAHETLAPPTAGPCCTRTDVQVRRAVGSDDAVTWSLELTATHELALGQSIATAGALGLTSADRHAAPPRLGWVELTT